MSDTLLGALIGFAGLILGLVSNELLRRRSRIEQYSQEIFLRRLQVYEGLYQKLRATSNVVYALEKDPSENWSNILDESSSVFLDLARYTDECKLYLDEEVVMHCYLTALVLPTRSETLAQFQEGMDEKIKEYWENMQIATLLIREETGLSELNKLYRHITKPKHNSEYIKEYQKNKKRA